MQAKFWMIFSSRLTAHGSRLTAHGSRLTAHGSRLTAHGSRLTAHVSAIKWLGVFTGLLLSISSIAQEVIPDFYKGPGIDNNRSYVNQNFNEHIDPFSGALSLQYTDLHLPGNGGFDLAVIRSYNSASIDPLNPYETESYAGLGWTVHFGRVLKSKDNVICNNVNQTSVADNPVLELQDGSKQLLAFTGSTSPLMLTTQRWKADCMTGGVAVYSPEGTRYDMTRLVNVGTQFKPVYAWYTTKITDKNGNYATIAYTGTATAQMSSITTNDGRSITFTYADSGTITRRISSISGAGKTYNYGYTAISGVTGKYQLTSVTRPDGTRWSYVYNGNVNSVAVGSYAVKQVTYPQGGSISYGYQFIYFDSASNPSSRSTVISSKSSSAGGSWSFQYAPGAVGRLDVTTVNGPSGTTTYKHIGPNYTTSGTVWSVGLLYSKTIGNQQTETYTWDKQKISNESFFRPGAFVTKVDAGATYASVPVTTTISRNNANYVTQYSNYDAYGNPMTVAETGPNGGSKSTTLSYNLNTTKWIINQRKNESFTGSSITRSFDANGNLTQKNVDGVITSYSYDSQGNVSVITYPRGLTHTFSNYYRGIPRFESQPEAISISRVVSDAGNVTAETNGEGYTTNYSYDGLNRVTSIIPPLGNTVFISYGTASKTATRGILSESTIYDGFGKPTSVTLGGITTSYRYDTLGRMTFESNPGDTIGATTTYDILDRPSRITNADNTSVNISYGAGTKSVTDENNTTTQYTYRSYGSPSQQLLMQVTAADATANVSLVRNSKGLVTSMTQAGLTRSFVYSSKYFVTAETDPETGTTTYGRDDAGNMTSRTVGFSSPTSFAYDNQNRLKTVSYPSNIVNYSYNKTNKMLSTSSTFYTRNYAYNNNGSLTSESLISSKDSSTVTASYDYNSNDQLQGIQYPYSNKYITYTLDALGRPTAINNYVSAVTYWPSGQVKQINYANNTITTYGQNARLWPASFRTSKTGGSTYLNTAYGYDGLGNLKSISDATDTSFNRTMSYDNLNRLTSISGPWGAGSVSYNGSGNITRQAFGSWAINYNYNSSNQLTGISGSKTENYTYDTYGNVSNAGAINYGYDEASNLTCINCAASQPTATFDYDGTGARVLYKGADSVGTFTIKDFQSANGNLLGDTIDRPGNFKRSREYIYLGGKRVVQLCTPIVNATKCVGNEVNYYHNDISGTPLASTDSAGNLVWKETYRPYGERITKIGGINRLWFAGKAGIQESEILYMGARYYDPVIGRFLGADPKGVDPENIHSFNRYSYANNNPYKYVDPDGHSPIDVVFLAYDIGKLGVALYTGVGAGAALADVAMSVVGVASPVPFAGQAMKAARAADKAVDAVRGAEKVARKTGGESAAAARGREAHKNYENTLGGGYEFNKALPSGKRPDAIDVENKIVRELKPDNPRAIKRGEKQLEGYRSEAEKNFGGQWTSKLDTYKQ